MAVLSVLFMVKAIIFDLDGTLVDSGLAHIKSYELVLKDMGLSVKREVLSREFGKVAEDILKSVFQSMTISDIKKVVTGKRKHFLDLISLVKPKSCAGEFLKTASNNYVLAIATSSSKREMDLILKAMGWLDYFSVLVTSYDVASPKPAPDILLRTASLLKVPVSDCLFIGDSIFDARSALAAKMTFLGVSTGSYLVSDFKAEGFTSFSNLCDLLSYLF